MTIAQTTPIDTTVSTAAWQRVFAAAIGAALVAVGAQLAVPVPGTVVPLTFQVPAVLIVGALLGPRYGAASMVLYLMLGATGLPVFAPGGVPGVARLFGPTGGYLLAYPVAAALVGRLALTSGGVRRLGALVLGLVVIHLGGVAQLAVLGGDLSMAVRAGSLPFLAGDVAKLLLALLVIGRLARQTRALR